jgi:hypothetical protein
MKQNTLDMITTIMEVNDEGSALFTEAMDFFRSQLGSRTDWTGGVYYAIVDLPSANEAGRIGEARDHEEALEIALSRVPFALETRGKYC